jgi:hypothetical protein
MGLMSINFTEAVDKANITPNFFTITPKIFFPFLTNFKFGLNASIQCSLKIIQMKGTKMDAWEEHDQ